MQREGAKDAKVRKGIPSAMAADRLSVGAWFASAGLPSFSFASFAPLR